MKLYEVDPNNLPVGKVLAWNGKELLTGYLQKDPPGGNEGIIVCRECEVSLSKGRGVLLLANVTHYALVSEIEAEFKREANKYYYKATGEKCPAIDRDWDIGSLTCENKCRHEQININENWIICPALNKYKAEQNLVNKTNK
jgi:hypothetical protein